MADSNAFFLNSIIVCQPIADRRLTPRWPRNRPCASRNESTFSPRGAQVKNLLLHRRTWNYCRPLVAQVWPKITEVGVAPSPKQAYLRKWDSFIPCCFFHVIKYVGQQLELRPGVADFWAGYLSERLWTDSEKCMADCSVYRSNRHERNKKVKTVPNNTWSA